MVYEGLPCFSAHRLFSIIVAKQFHSWNPTLAWRRIVKLSLLFVLIDLMVLLAYPIVFVIHQVRKLFQAKR